MNQLASSKDNQFLVAGIAAFVVVSVALIVYLLTMSRSIGWHDSAELALAAWQLGASHAPGSPLHSLLGHITAQIFAAPFLGVTFLSVLSATVSAGILAFLIVLISGDILAAVCAGLLYAFSYQVWTSAVITEVYSLGMMFLSIALVAVYLWQRDRARWQMAIMAGFYALSLAAYFANILLLPAFCCLIFMVSASRLKDLIIFLVVAGCAVVAISLANYQLAMVAAPFGEVLPNTLQNIFLYMSGAQHNPLELSSISHLAGRFWQHGKMFISSVLIITIPFGLAGCYGLIRKNKNYGFFLLSVFAIYFLYYTIFGPGDYYMMVLPAYFAFAIWFACGVTVALRSVENVAVRLFLRGFSPLLVVALLAVQFDSRYAYASSTEAEEFAEVAFAVLPENAVAIVGWKEFSTLRYMQEVKEQRPDVRVIVPARSFRLYNFAAVNDYLLFVAAEICTAPVYTIKAVADLPAEYNLAAAGLNDPWRKITLDNKAMLNRCSGKQK